MISCTVERFGYLQQHHGTFFFQANPSLGQSNIFFTEGGDPTQVGLMSSAERFSFLQRFYENSPQRKFVHIAKRTWKIRPKILLQNVIAKQCSMQKSRGRYQ